MLTSLPILVIGGLVNAHDQGSAAAQQRRLRLGWLQPGRAAQGRRQGGRLQEQDDYPHVPSLASHLGTPGWRFCPRHSGERGLEMVRLLRALNKPSTTVAVVPWLRTDGSPTLDESLLELSERLREAGAAALVLSGCGTRHVELLIEEQRSASGQYPSSCPIIYAPPPSPAPDFAAIAACGADAVLLPHAEWQEQCAETGQERDGQLLVPHATTVEELELALVPAATAAADAAPSARGPSRLVVASGRASEVLRSADGETSDVESGGGATASDGGVLPLVELPLEALGDASTASLRAAGAQALTDGSAPCVIVATTCVRCYSYHYCHHFCVAALSLPTLPFVASRRARPTSRLLTTAGN